MNAEWFWEGNVAETVRAHLEAEGWLIEHIANTETRESGVDIEARKAGRILLAEIKGFPSKVYQRGKNVGQPKPTNPNTQARHWYGEVLLSSILRQEKHPGAEVAIAFPNFPTFKYLVGRTRKALITLGISVYCVEENGSVTKLELRS